MTQHNPTDEQAEQPASCRVLTDDEYETAYRAGRDTIGATAASRIGSMAITDIAAAVLATVGILTPPPAPETGTCTAMYADPGGVWWQCVEEPGHDAAHGHDSGDWAWAQDAPNSIPPRTAEAGE